MAPSVLLHSPRPTAPLSALRTQVGVGQQKRRSVRLQPLSHLSPSSLPSSPLSAPLVPSHLLSPALPSPPLVHYSTPKPATPRLTEVSRPATPTTPNAFTFPQLKVDRVVPDYALRRRNAICDAVMDSEQWQRFQLAVMGQVAG